MDSELSKYLGKRLYEIEDPERYFLFEGQNLLQHVICIHCGKDYLLGQSIIGSDDLVQCADPDCDGCMFDFCEVKDKEQLPKMKKALGFQ